MKRLLIALSILLLAASAFAGPLQDAHKRVIAARGVASGGGTTYVGWANTNGTPTGTPSSSYAALNNLSCRKWTADITGTISTLNAYISVIATPTYEGLCVYRDIEGTLTLIGTAVYTGSNGTWTGNISVDVESGQSLSVSVDDVFYFGVAGLTSANQYAVGRNDAGGDGMYYNGSSVVTTEGPPSTVTLNLSSSREMAFIMGISQ
jgi:hypothetical protein